ncbi:uncharacterized protein LY89DRAFT_350958 [Mollisia scopiformis]|uniref:CorA-like transporter domain-containing protein n=1 Tax=Mollisia scopiformis TaxID=149040 RepID=A0A132B723_MOLSC|nr:uncharacterized protein LY89DRAFT_350958 [Mollisia scopiformis]KUJ08141.1 hypothetical protein LY89DRAFT_350958 [Mollisia scopiformis]
MSALDQHKPRDGTFKLRGCECSQLLLGDFLGNSASSSQHLHEQSSRLFSDASPIVEILLRQWSDNHMNHSLESIHIHDLDGLERALSKIGCDGTDAVFIFRQSCTWGRIECSESIFRRIMEATRAFSPLYDFVSAFGYKLSATDENLGCFQGHVSNVSDKKGIPEFELAYNVRYAHKHGRQLRDPWSIRHSAIYQRYEQKTNSTHWVIIQPSESFYCQLKQFLHPNRTTSALETAAVIHSAFLWDGGRNWRQYINYLEKELSNLEDKSLLSRIGLSLREDFSISFLDVQRLLALRKKMHKCSTIMDISMDIGQSHESLWQKVLGMPDHPSLNDNLVSSMGMYKARIQNHRRSIRYLINSSSDILDLTSKILVHKNEELLIRSGLDIQLMNQTTNLIAAETRDEHRNSVTVLKSTKEDSEKVKILTYVAMVYLPASLVASVFSSSLIQVDSSSGIKNRLYLPKYFWLFPLLSIGLLGVTTLILVILSWWRQSRK